MQVPHIIALMRNYTFTSGGVQKHGRELYLDLAKLNCQITIIANKANCEKQNPYTDGGLQVIPLDFPDLFYHRYGKKYWKYVWDQRKFVRALKPYIKANSVIHAHWIQEGMLAGFYGSKLGIPVYFSCHGMYAAKHLKRFVTRSRFWRRYWAKQALGLTGLNTMSKTMTQYLVENCPANALKVQTIYNAVDTSKYTTTRQWADLSVLKFCYIGRLVKYKHIDLVIKALHKYQQVSKQQVVLSIAGEGEEYERLQNLITALNFNNSVVFEGYVRDIPNYIQQFHFYISASEIEGMPNAPLEAMASGLIPILSDIGQHQEIVYVNQGGILFETNSENDLVAKLLTLLEHNLDQMSKLAQQCVKEQFDTERKNKAYLSFLTKP